MNPALVGGKGASLGRLIGTGFPVPNCGGGPDYDVLRLGDKALTIRLK